MAPLWKKNKEQLKSYIWVSFFNYEVIFNMTVQWSHRLHRGEIYSKNFQQSSNRISNFSVLKNITHELSRFHLAAFWSWMSTLRLTLQNHLQVIYSNSLTEQISWFKPATSQTTFGSWHTTESSLASKDVLISFREGHGFVLHSCKRSIPDSTPYLSVRVTRPSDQPTVSLLESHDPITPLLVHHRFDPDIPAVTLSDEMLKISL